MSGERREILTEQNIADSAEHFDKDRTLAWGLRHNIRRICDSHEALRAEVVALETTLAACQRECQAEVAENAETESALAACQATLARVEQEKEALKESRDDASAAVRILVRERDEALARLRLVEAELKEARLPRYRKLSPKLRLPPKGW